MIFEENELFHKNRKEIERFYGIHMIIISVSIS